MLLNTLTLVAASSAAGPLCPVVTPAVTVVIPAYNAMRYLPKALESVLAQTYQNFEVCIINDGSQDNITDWYDELSADIRRRVTLLSQPNQGISSARNAGIIRSRSPYIAFLDADDIWLPHMLERQIAYLEDHPSVSLVYSAVAMVDVDGHLLGRVYGASVEPPLPTCSASAARHRLNTWSRLVVNNVIPTPSAVLVRRSCLLSVGLFDLALSSYVEDKDLWLRIARAHTVQSLPEILTHKRRHSTNTSKQWDAMEKASEQVLIKAFSSFPANLSTQQLQMLRRKSYGETYFKLAWKPLQTDDVDIKIAFRYFLKALSYCPNLIGSKEAIKLVCVMCALQLCGTQLYRSKLKQLSGLRYQLSRLLWVRPF
ncbi:MAG: glycosyltransferase family A protein [Cyanobacteria bacterium P01_F01_bin.53]